MLRKAPSPRYHGLMRVAALLLGAGRGERLRHALPKALVPLDGQPLIAHALATLEATPEIDLVVPVVPESEQRAFESALAVLHDSGKRWPCVPGGVERQDSVAAGLRALPEDVGWVAVHDAARPRVRVADVSRVVAAAREAGAAILAVPAADTLKRVRDGLVVETPPRSECWAAQTPQVFAVDLLRDALGRAAAEGRRGSDCSQLVEALGVPVRVVEGDPGNFKITAPRDLALAEALRVTDS